jgi:hypothetical protein
MATNLAIDDKLLVDAMRIGQMKTKRETVNLALQEFILRRKQREIVSVFGTFDFDPKYDYKKSRDT